MAAQAPSVLAAPPSFVGAKAPACSRKAVPLPAGSLVCGQKRAGLGWPPGMERIRQAGLAELLPHLQGLKTLRLLRLSTEPGGFGPDGERDASHESHPELALAKQAEEHPGERQPWGTPKTPSANPTSPPVKPLGLPAPPANAGLPAVGARLRERRREPPNKLLKFNQTMQKATEVTLKFNEPASLASQNALQ